MPRNRRTAFSANPDVFEHLFGVPGVSTNPEHRLQLGHAVLGSCQARFLVSAAFAASQLQLNGRYLPSIW